MVCRAGEIMKLKIEGVPIGLLASREYEELPLQTKPRDFHAQLQNLVRAVRSNRTGFVE